jgi:hypothetical protein
MTQSSGAEAKFYDPSHLSQSRGSKRMTHVPSRARAGDAARRPLPCLARADPDSKALLLNVGLVRGVNE